MSLHLDEETAGRSVARPTDPIDDRGERIAIIGAGTSGLAMAKALADAGLPFDCLEREDDLGGNWNRRLACSSVCDSTHLISSKEQTEYADFPMPEHWPAYPSHRLVLDYLRAYANRFRLTEKIEFGAGVRRLAPHPGGGWLVRLESGERRRYARVAIANGHNWDPSWPDFPGGFDGLTLHSGEYKTPEILAGQRVLVVGGGNSGCDIAVESGRHAAATRLSLRRGYHFLPKFFHGTPIDVCGERMLRWRLPLWLRRLLAGTACFFLQGTRAGTGLPKPDHRLFETHPTINSQLIDSLRHGDLEVRPNVERLLGDRVRFTDGSEEPFDVIVYATGFRLSFPFLDRELLNWVGDERSGRPELFLNVFHPRRDDLFVLGMIQPDSGQWGLVEAQAKLVAAYLVGVEAGAAAAERFRERKAVAEEPGPIRYVDSPRHRLEVEHFSYRRTLKRELRRLRRGASSRSVAAAS